MPMSHVREVYLPPHIIKRIPPSGTVGQVDLLLILEALEFLRSEFLKYDATLLQAQHSPVPLCVTFVGPESKGNQCKSEAHTACYALSNNTLQSNLSFPPKGPFMGESDLAPGSR